MVTFPDGTTDTLNVPIDPSIAAIIARYPKPNDPTGPYQSRTYATPSKVDTNANQFSIRIDHKFSDKDQFFARFNYNNLTGPTTNPDQTAIDPVLRRSIHRPPAQRRGHLDAHRHAAPHIRVVHQHHALHARLSHQQLR